MLTATGNRIRYRIAAQQARDFCHKFIVECPRCNGCAELIPIYEEGDDDRQSRHGLPMAKFPLQPGQFHCRECELVRNWQETELNELFTLVDWFKELELYLQAVTDDRVVWALNFEHHQFLEEQLREAIANPKEVRDSIPSLAEWPEPIDAESLLEALKHLEEDGAHHASEMREQQRSLG